MGVLPVYRQSFFCGPDREDGLRLTMIYEDGMVYADMCVDNRFEGYEDIVHGGMIFGILDVIMWYIIFMETEKICMTRKTEMEFLKPVLCSTHYWAKGKVEHIEDRDIYASAWVEDEQGECYARVTALFREGKDIPVPAFIGRFDFSRSSPEIRKFFISLLERHESQKA